MKKFWMIGLLALASANSFQTTCVAADNIYKPIQEKLKVSQLPVDHINKAVGFLEKQNQGGESNQNQMSDLQKTTNLIKVLKQINTWGDQRNSNVPEKNVPEKNDLEKNDLEKKIVDYLSDLGEVSSLLKQTKPCAELDPIAQHIIHIKKQIRSEEINLIDFGKVNDATNIELIPLKFFKDPDIFQSSILKKATVFELEKAIEDVQGISTKTREDIKSLIKYIKNKTYDKIEKINIDEPHNKKIEEAVNKVINSQSAGAVKNAQTAEPNQKKEPKKKTPSRRQRRLANQNKGDKKGKKKSFWKKLRFWKWFGKKKKNKMNQTAAAPKRRSQSLKPTVTVTDVPAKNNPEAGKIEEAVNRVINSQSAGAVKNAQTAEPNQNKGDKKGKKKSFWKKLRSWKWFGTKKKNKMNQTAAAPKRRSQSLKPTVTVTGAANEKHNPQQTPSVYNL